MNDYKNIEGYADPTPYQAMNRVFPGEVWESFDRTLVVLGVRENVASVLMLGDQAEHTNYEVRGLHTNVAMVSYTFTNKLQSFKFTLKDKEFEELKSKIADYLDTPRVRALDTATERDTSNALVMMYGSHNYSLYCRMKMVDDLLKSTDQKTFDFTVDVVSKALKEE